LYREQGQLEEALADFSKAIEIEPNLAIAYSNRGTIYLKLIEIQNAIRDFTQAIKLNPNYAINQGG
jgi:tetratricopeptide (TPR) repeat protein